MEQDYEVGIVGAGFAGIIAALALQKAGRHSFVIWERAAEVGGTWRDNIYPGCACDVAVHLYSIAGHPNSDWNHLYARQPEILHYLKDVVTQNGLSKHIRFTTDIVEAAFIKEDGCWKVTAQNGYSTRVRVLMFGAGPLNRPNIPSIRGIGSFGGRSFHTSQWDYSCALNGKRVAVIGTGASAVQVIPEIASVVAHLSVFQRTPAWVVHRRDRQISPFKKAIYRRFPVVQKMFREKIYWLNELFGLSFLGNRLLNRIATLIASLKLKKEVADPELRKKLLPRYKIGCKRILKSDDYYPTFNRSNVSLVTANIEQITPAVIITKDGTEHPADVLIFGTGFIAAEINIDTRIIGLEGDNLIDKWKEGGAEAYRGTTISGYPNLAFLLGPNTGLGHNSVVHMMESQMNYLLPYIQLLEQSGVASYLDVKPDIQKNYNEDIQKRLSGTVWASGCKSWYLNASGKNTTIYPGLTQRYRKELKRFNREDYTVVQQPVYQMEREAAPV